MPKLVLMRHGEAQAWASTDAKRPLSSAGQAQVIKQGQDKAIPWCHLQQVFVSPFLRTQQTCWLLQNTLSASFTIPWSAITSDLITPYGQTNSVQDWLLDCPLVDSLLVTHQPLISELIGYFCYADRQRGETMLPASVAVLEGDVFARGCMGLKVLVHA